jgi:NADPH oxidase 1
MELRIVKPSFKYVAGQWLFLQVPELSKFQWHPFTITSAPEDPYVSVHIRQVGDFTRALGDRLGVGPSVVASMTQAALKGTEKDNKDATRGDFVELDGALSLPALRIDGPYGAPAEDVFNKQVAVLVGAGIGVLVPRISVVLTCSFIHIPRRHTFRIHSQAYLVHAKERKPRYSPTS